MYHWPDANLHMTNKTIMAGMNTSHDYSKPNVFKCSYGHLTKKLFFLPIWTSYRTTYLDHIMQPLLHKVTSEPQSTLNHVTCGDQRRSKPERVSRWTPGKCENSRLDHTKYHSRTRWPGSEAIPPVIFVILLRAGATVEVMCRELVWG